MIKRPNMNINNLLFKNYNKQFYNLNKILIFLPFIRNLFKIKVFKSKFAILQKEQRQQINTKLYLQRKAKREKKLQEQLKTKKLIDKKYNKYKRNFKPGVYNYNY
jgi:hypothetical protein